MAQTTHNLYQCYTTYNWYFSLTSEWEKIYLSEYLTITVIYICHFWVLYVILWAVLATFQMLLCALHCWYLCIHYVFLMSIEKKFIFIIFFYKIITQKFFTIIIIWPWQILPLLGCTCFCNVECTKSTQHLYKAMESRDNLWIEEWNKMGISHWCKGKTGHGLRKSTQISFAERDRENTWMAPVSHGKVVTALH